VEIPSLLCTGGILKPPTPPEPAIIAVKLTPKCTSVAGLNQCAPAEAEFYLALTDESSAYKTKEHKSRFPYAQRNSQ
jgi:hypothetical protein